MNILKLTAAKDALYGGLIYCAGDSIAAIITDNFYFPRMLAMLLLGATLYAIEIPAYFRWLDRRFRQEGHSNKFKRMFLAVAFFNPLWIARHIIFIHLFSAQWSDISPAILSIALTSFIYSLPVTVPVNYIIQNTIPLTWRFFASSVFSAIMAIYFSLSEVLFG